MRGFAMMIVVVSAMVVGCAQEETRKGSKDDAGGMTSSGEDATFSKKIAFDVERLNEDGLYGPPDGLRALHYEFCIPTDERFVDEVTAIDTTVEVQRHSPGRIGCKKDQYLCIGNTHQKDFRGVLNKLAALYYVQEIRQTHFE